MTENKLNQFGHNVRIGRLLKTVWASFNTITRQMTEMSPWKTQVQLIIAFNVVRAKTSFKHFICHWKKRQLEILLISVRSTKTKLKSDKL